MANKSKKTESSKRERLTVMVLSFSGLLFSISTVYVGFFHCPFRLPHLATLTDRMVFTLRCQVFSVLTLLMGVFICGNQRFFSRAINPLANQENLVAVNKQYVQNTSEQLLLSVVGQLILTTYLQEESMKLIPILVSLFVIGRLAFWIGYHVDPVKRAFGFSCTVLPNTAILVYCLFSALWNGVSFGLGPRV